MITDSPCGDPTCYRGGIGEWNYAFKDGPCQARDCKWTGQTRPHFTDMPAKLTIQDGRHIWTWD